MSEEIDLAGFLQGGRRLPWREVAFSPELDAGEWRSIECFQTRAREFLLNASEFRRVNQLHLARDTPRVRVSVVGYPGRHRAKGLFVDFRHLLADDEPGTFRRTRNIVRRRTTDEALCAFLDGLNEGFLPTRDDPTIEFMGAACSIEELLRLWFNTEFFHSGDSKQLAARERMLEVLDESGAGPLLFWTVVRTAHPVKGLYACVKELRRGGPLSVRCPDRQVLNLR